MTQLNENFIYQGADYATTKTSAELPRHRWYLIKEGFSPKLVDAALDSLPLTQKDCVFDPFAGCGTVPLTVAERGLPALGFEVNPFLAFVSGTKVKNCDIEQLRSGARTVLRAAETFKKSRSPLEGYSTFSPRRGADRWLFNTEILRIFTAASNAVLKTPAAARRFLRLALVKAVMDTCNARADGKCLRYKKDWKTMNYGAEEFVKSFEAHLEIIGGDLSASHLDTNPSVITCDSREVLKTRSEKFRLCITSPPYLNSFDYSDVYRPELFLMGMVKNTDELRRIRLRTVRSHVQVHWKDPKDSDFGELYKDTFSDLKKIQDQLWDRRIPTMVQAYFEDMKGVLRQLHRLALDKAQAWLVVSTSAYGGIEIPVDLILANIGTQTGWLLREVGVIRYIRHSGHHWRRIPEKDRPAAKLRESVVVLERLAKAR